MNLYINFLIMIIYLLRIKIKLLDIFIEIIQGQFFIKTEKQLSPKLHHIKDFSRGHHVQMGCLRGSRNLP
jgi:maltodextrin utilization protein YvdJ